MDALLTASRNYNEILEETIENRTREKYKELQIIYDINQLRAEHARESGLMQRNIMLIAITASVVLLVLLAVALLLSGMPVNLPKIWPAPTRLWFRKALT